MSRAAPWLMAYSWTARIAAWSVAAVVVGNLSAGSSGFARFGMFAIIALPLAFVLEWIANSVVGPAVTLFVLWATDRNR